MNHTRPSVVSQWSSAAPQWSSAAPQWSSAAPQWSSAAPQWSSAAPQWMPSQSPSSLTQSPSSLTQSPSSLTQSPSSLTQSQSDSYSDIPDLVSCDSLSSMNQDMPYSPHTDRSNGSDPLSKGYEKYLYGIDKHKIKIFGTVALICVFIYFKKR
jgi:hypothetical protein